jgi:hypothetical protein
MVNYSNLLRNAILDQYDTHFPAGSKLQLRSGAPAGANNPAGGVLLVDITLPTTPWLPAVAGVKGKNGIWSDIVLVSGTIGHYRLVNGSKVEEGTITVTAGGGDLTVNTVNATLWRIVTVTAFNKSL